MITAAQQTFINSALPVFKRDERIAGVALEGSYIKRETMDEFSGLDFLIVVFPDFYDEIMQEREEIAGKLGTLISCFTGEHITRPDLLICLFDTPLLHVDLYFVLPETLSSRYENPIVMYETKAVISSVIASTPVSPASRDFQWFEDRFWIWLHFAAGRAGRGELFDAIGSLDFLRENILGPMIQIKSGYPPRGVRHIERDAPGEVTRLAETIARFDKQDCIRALKAAANLYISLRDFGSGSMILRDVAERRALSYLSYIESNS